MYRIIVVAIATLSVVSLGGCSKNSEPTKGDSVSKSAPAGQAGSGQANPDGVKTPPPGNPQGGSNPHGGTGADPHAGMNMGKASGKGVGGAEPTAKDGTKKFTPFTLTVPKSWSESAPTSSMRAAQFKIGDAELVVFYFGTGQGGTVEANVARWYGQFEQPDGSATKDKAKREEKKIDGLDVTLISVKGRFVANVRPTSDKKHNKPGHQMLAAIVQTDNGPYFFKMVGPEDTVTAAEKDFAAMINSIKKN